jgi:hypothetical protein
MDWSGLGILLFCVVALAFLQRRLHFELQALFFMVTHRADVSMVLFSLIFFPGVFLHEASHYLAARLLGVRTGHLSLIPKPLPNGRLQLGYVETARVDALRDAFIGLAPLLVGGAFVAYVGLVQLGLATLMLSWESSTTWHGFLPTLGEILPGINQRPDFYLWFYLVFAVSSTMLPSSSDRRTWLMVLLVGVVGLGLILLVGAGAWFVAQTTPLLNQAVWASAIVFGISAAIHLVVWLPLWGIRVLVMRIGKMRI